jgi:hypothetical protein
VAGRVPDKVIDAMNELREQNDQGVVPLWM